MRDSTQEEVEEFFDQRGGDWPIVYDTDFEFVGLNRSVFPASCRPNAVPREEWQANRFAGARLIHPPGVR